MTTTSYIFIYLVFALFSFFAFERILKLKSEDAQTAVVASFLFPLAWFILIFVGGGIWLIEMAEKYLERNDEK